MNWKKKAYELYKLLDDIDTASDLAKADDDVYRVMVRLIHIKRHEVIPEAISDELYEEFYP